MTASVHRLGRTSSSKRACVPTSTSTSPAATRASTASRSAGGVDPVSTPHEMPAWSNSGPRLLPCWRASTSVGAMSSAWPPVSAAAASACAATTVLPVPTSPRSRWFAVAGAASAARMSSRAAFCSSVSSQGSAAASAVRRGPSVTWRTGSHPSARSRPSSMSMSSRNSSSSYTRRRRASEASSMLRGKWMAASAAPRLMRRYFARSSSGSGSYSPATCVSALPTSRRTQAADSFSVAGCTGMTMPAAAPSAPSSASR